MSSNGIIQIVLFLAILLALVKPLGAYMARVYEGRPIWLERLFGPLERLIYRWCGIAPDQQMSWKTYAAAMLLFNVGGGLAAYFIQRVQGWLPLNPAGFGAVAPELAFNTAVSFATNTNWQGYGGETTMSYLTQMTALTVHNFLSAATGMGVLMALIRGLARRETKLLGNFWVDTVRGTIYILLPLSLVLALALVSQGVVQTFGPYQKLSLVQPTTFDSPVVDKDGKPVLGPDGQPKTEKKELSEQTVALGPAASQVAIKHLGTNGGGFFNVNSAHPLENPTPLSNLLELLAILAFPGALCFTFGTMVRDTRQGWTILTAMTAVLVAMVVWCYVAEQSGNPRLTGLGVNQQFTEDSAKTLSGGNMEGKEVRFGIANSAIFAAVTTATSCGAVNSMHDSFTPLGGKVPMLLIQLGEVIFGGVGSGLYGMLIFVIVAVFIAGLMVGRTPDYLGKKIEALVMKMVSLVFITPLFLVLTCTAVAIVTEVGKAGISNPGAHGF
ncbi:MAG: potassium-transporting ATPase subunit KdpA, partial [Deltaproteobacteria bacterium]|nr:potassium-transporting ATPase subunit KdpA [Deltaproteobacteria bacterium]